MIWNGFGEMGSRLRKTSYKSLVDIKFIRTYSNIIRKIGGIYGFKSLLESQ